MSNVWFSSDWHIGHRKVAELRGFSSTDEHDAAIFDHHAATVKKDDVLWILGDMVVGGHEGVVNMLAQLSKLPGHKRLVAGNHDQVHPMHQNSNKHFKEWSTVFEHITPFHRLKFSCGDLLLSHFPYGNIDHTEEPRYKQWRLGDWNTPLAHGHTHSSIKYSESACGTRMFHVGLDAWDMKFVEQSELLQWLRYP